MKLETFFNKFDELADTPNGLKQLRELVRQLAVEGGLVPHLAAETAVPYASVEDATPINVSDVPENWRVVLLADAIKNRSGNSKLIKGKLHEEPAPGRFQGFSASGADVWCDDFEHEGQAIIISAVGARCGKAFKASGKWSAIANTNITRPDLTLFDFDFAFLVLNNEHFWVRGGSAQPFVKFPPSLDRHFALPPFAEQKRIVAKVNELMALCDRLEAQQQERETRHTALARAALTRFADVPTSANLSFLSHSSYNISPADLRTAILTLAVQGKLVPQDPNDEPSDELLKRITLHHKKGVAKNRGLQEHPFKVPATWCWVNLGDFVESMSNGIYKPSKFYSETGTACVRMFNIQDGRLDLTKLKRLDLTSSEIDQYRLEVGDLLVNRVNSRELVGKCAIVEESEEPLVFEAMNIRVRLVARQHLPSYVNLVLRTDRIRKLFQSSSKQAVGQASINQPQVAGVAIPIPPLAEQCRIVAKVGQLMALVDALEMQITDYRATAANLLSALVVEVTQRQTKGRTTV